MRKSIFSFAIAAVAALTMASCTDGKNAGNNGENADSAAVTETAEQPAEEATKSVTRQFYTVALPAGWEASQSFSGMTVKNDAIKLTFNETNPGDAAQKAEEYAKNAESKLDDITLGDITWHAFKKFGDYKVLYLAQVGKGIVYVMTNDVEDGNNADVLKVLQGVGPKSAE